MNEEAQIARQPGLYQCATCGAEVYVPTGDAFPSCGSNNHVPRWLLQCFPRLCAPKEGKPPAARPALRSPQLSYGHQRNLSRPIESRPFSAAGKSFSIHEWRGSGPATLHVHHSDDEAWHVLEGELTFRYADRTETAGPGKTVFVPAGMAHTYSARADARYLIILTPQLSSLIWALQADPDPAHEHEIYQRFDSELLE